MAVAFHLLAHKDPAQLGRLIDALWSPDNVYVVHYDRRRPAGEHRAVSALAATRPNIVVQPPTAVLWGRFSLIRAQLVGLELALRQPQPWTHWVNLSGQCFPLHAPAEIATRLAATGDTSFVRHFDPLGPDSDWRDAAGRLERDRLDSPVLEWWLRLPGLGRRLRRFFGGASAIPSLPRRRPRETPWFKWYGGDNWVVLSRTAAEQTVSRQGWRIAEWFRGTAFPEESVFQTIVRNLACGPVENDHLRCINWQGGLASPQNFRAADLPVLTSAAARGALFARKFDTAVDARILELLTQRLSAAPAANG
ncbi:MAG TPA: beta-1,6-N-acetylglucosaminyltransferase [Opitutaceae bacterium]|nr:beta-1,6-N-acetylglucosaminyltransferase [Opitutaceae bacterium]